jgi:hypothetical protein
VVQLISVERKKDAFSIPLLTTCAFSHFMFQLQLPFECINFLEKEGQRLLSESSFGFKEILLFFLLFKISDCSTISRFVVVLVTIVTPHVEPLRILRRLI